MKLSTMIPVIIINGPLGSGKTTLIHAILNDHFDAKRTLWLKTEFGDESIDQLVLADTQVKTKDLTGGCICHVLLSELESVLVEIQGMQDIDQVIIETSGMSHPEPVVQAITRNSRFCVANVSLIVDVLHAHEESYPKPMILPLGTNKPYDLIILNKYKTTFAKGDEGALEKVLDPWYAGTYADIEKFQIPDEHEDTSIFKKRVKNLTELLVEALNAVQNNSLNDPLDTFEEPMDQEKMEDHEGEMDVLTFHIPADHIVVKETIEQYAQSVPQSVVRIKGIFRTGTKTWEFFNWVRGTGKWTVLDVSPNTQTLLVMGQDIRENQNIQTIDI